MKEQEGSCRKQAPYSHTAPAGVFFECAGQKTQAQLHGGFLACTIICGSSENPEY